MNTTQIAKVETAAGWAMMVYNPQTFSWHVNLHVEGAAGMDANEPISQVTAALAKFDEFTRLLASLAVYKMLSTPPTA